MASGILRPGKQFSKLAAFLTQGSCGRFFPDMLEVYQSVVGLEFAIVGRSVVDLTQVIGLIGAQFFHMFQFWRNQQPQKLNNKRQLRHIKMIRGHFSCYLLRSWLGLKREVLEKISHSCFLQMLAELVGFVLHQMRE